MACFTLVSYAQDVPSGFDAGALLKGTEISQTELNTRLKTKGVDLTNVAPEDLPKIQGTIENTIKELQQEKGQQTANGVAEDLTVNNELSKEDLQDKFDLENINTSDVGKRVQDGSSIEEAISEEEIKRQATDSLQQVRLKAASLIYGHSLFFNESIDFYRTSSAGTPPDYYILDVGDKIAINIFGRSQADLIYQIENDGFIRPSGMYKVYLKGLPYGKAKEVLFERFQATYLYGKGQFNVDLNTARTVRVNIFGEVYNPGTYTVSALNSVLSAIIASGGPTNSGSVRNIRVIRGGKEFNIDVYEYLTNPELISDFGLENGTTIFIPPIDKVVNLAGPFMHKGQFEIKTNETVENLLKLAGGARKNVVLQNYNVVRLENGESKLYTYDFESTKTMELQDLDKLSFRTHTRSFENFVVIEGAVRFAGSYELKETKTLKTLLEGAILEDFTKRDIAYVTRKNPNGTYNLIPFSPKLVLGGQDSFVLQNQDKVTLLNLKNFQFNYSFSIEGAVNKPLEKHFWDPNKSIRLSDAINLAGGLKENATKFGYVNSRSTESSKEVVYKMVNLEEAANSPLSELDVFISPYDKIIVPTVEQFQETFYVRIEGAVKNPGRYVYDESLTLKDVITRSGGLKLEAASNKVDVFRLKIDGNNPTVTLFYSLEVNRAIEPLTDEDRVTLAPYDIIVVRKIPDFKTLQTVSIEGQVKYPGLYAFTLGEETITDLIEKAGGLADNAEISGATLQREEYGLGFMAVDFKKVMRGHKYHDLDLADGDVVNIPGKIPAVKMRILGTNADEFYQDKLLTKGTLAAPFKRFKRAGHYIRTYMGGFDPDAKKGKTYVKYPNGRVRKAVNFGLFRLQPRIHKGSEIMVSMKPVLKKRLKEPQYIEQEDGTIVAVEKQRPEKERPSLTERLMTLNAMVSIATATTTSIISAVLLIERLQD